MTRRPKRPRLTKQEKADAAEAVRRFFDTIEPGCVSEFVFHPRRGWRFDYAWPKKKIALEIEGLGGRHQRTAGFKEDMIKYSEAAIFGWRLLRVTHRQVEDGTAAEYVSRIFNRSLDDERFAAA